MQRYFEVNSIVSGGITGTVATAASQVAFNELGNVCGCKNEAIPFKDLVTSSDYWLTIVLGSMGGAAGSLAGGSTSALSGWVGGNFGKIVVQKLVGGVISTSYKEVPKLGAER